MVTICQLQGEQQFKFRFKFHLNSPGQLGEPNLPFCSPAVMNSAVNMLLLMNCQILFVDECLGNSVRSVFRGDFLNDV